MGVCVCLCVCVCVFDAQAWKLDHHGDTLNDTSLAFYVCKMMISDRRFPLPRVCGRRSGGSYVHFRFAGSMPGGT